MKAAKHEFSVIVERDEDGYYVASVPELPGCHTQARSLDKLMERVREAIACFDDRRELARAKTRNAGKPGTDWDSIKKELCFEF